MSKQRSKIEHLVGFFPFGYTSRRAFYLLTEMPCDASYVAYSPNVNMEIRIAECDKILGSKVRYVALLLKGGFVEELRKKYGANRVDQFGMLRLTPAGLHLLTGTPSAEIESARIEQCMAQNYSYHSSVNFFPARIGSEVSRKMLFDLATARPLTDIQESYLEEIHINLLEYGSCTILGNMIDKALFIDIKSPAHNAMRQFRNWRESNIHALFAANSFLTPLDKRPIAVGWQKYLDNDSPPDCSEFPATTELSTLVEQSLILWYSKHPKSYLFRKPMLTQDLGLILDDKRTIPYESIPAYYSATEIPGFGGKTIEDYGYKTSGVQNTLNHNFCGLGIGVKTNYLIYHTRPGKMPWSENIERTSAAAVQSWLNRLNHDRPTMGAERPINNAIIVCNTVMQFAGLFNEMRKQIGNNEERYKRIGAPYSTVSIVILEQVGAQQMRSLMLESPIANDTALIYDFVKKYPDKFQKSSDPLFQLIYEGRPILVAHTMNFRRLYQAWMEYEKGNRFYIMCYPEQVKYLKKIMPEAEFL